MKVASITQAESKSVEMFDLHAGQWIIFKTDKSLESLTESQKDIYNKFFLVVTREDSSFESCRCTLIDENGKTYDYCPRMRSLGNIGSLSDTKILVVSSVKMESIFEKEKLESIYLAVQDHLDSMASYFEKYRVEKLNIELLKNKLYNPSQKDVKDYSLYGIPPDVLQFFSEVEGLNPEMLLMNGLQKKNCCSMINSFKSATFPLIKFYLATQQLSVEDLLNYNGYAIRDFAVHDKDFKFHNWLLENNLTMPPELVHSNWSNITALCDFSGIEYLSRKIFQFSRNEQQAQLNELVTKNCMNDKTICLRDSLASPVEVSWNTIENRFLKFKEKEKTAAEKYTQGPTSLMWLSAKKVSKIFTQEELEDIPEDFQSCVEAARHF